MFFTELSVVLLILHWKSSFLCKICNYWRDNSTNRLGLHDSGKNVNHNFFCLELRSRFSGTIFFSQNVYCTDELEQNKKNIVVWQRHTTMPLPKQCFFCFVQVLSLDEK